MPIRIDPKAFLNIVKTIPSRFSKLLNEFLSGFVMPEKDGY